MTTFTITPDAPFSLAASAAFGFGPNMGRPRPEAAGSGHAEMPLAFVTDDLRGQAGVHLTQDGDGPLHATIEGEADPAEVNRQVARILCLDHSGPDWLTVGERDPVVGELLRTHPGFRPVLFHSPYEAAAWSVISARRNRTQAAALRTRLSQAYGRGFVLAGEPAHAFPVPERLLSVEAFAGFEPVRITRLHAIARAALDGALEPDRLAALEPGAALAGLQKIPGIGPFYAGLILLRSTGVTDVLSQGEPRLAAYAAHFYRTGPDPLTPPQLSELAEKWRPFRTWAGVLIRLSGDRENIPFRP
jgi:DNA-3-methyladenine glycosylase II